MTAMAQAELPLDNQSSQIPRTFISRGTLSLLFLSLSLSSQITIFRFILDLDDAATNNPPKWER